METLTKDTFKEKIFDYETLREWKFSGTKPAIIDFYADWCGPCRALIPILEEVAQKYADKVDVYKVNTEMEPELASLFGVRSIPTILFIPLEGEPAVANGLMPVESFDKAIAEIFRVKF